MSYKLVTVVGARPQFVKASVVSLALREGGRVTEIIVHTGQHFDPAMSARFFDELSIPSPKHNLGIGGGTHGQNTGRMIESLEAVLIAEKPNAVLVYGDTDSTLAAAIAASKLNIELFHVEAGLRSWNRRMPEEINRVLTDHCSSKLFAPTVTAISNLAREGIEGDNVIQSGDVMFDATLRFSKIADQLSDILSSLGLKKAGYILATLHRKENVDDRIRLEAILSGLARSHLSVVFPVHPRTRLRLSEFGISIPSNVLLIDPVGYLDMITLEKNAFVIATDSGGVQKEAFFFGVPCVTLRDETEWSELVHAGANTLTGADAELISASINDAKFPDSVENFYGSGDAAKVISSSIG